ncbi:hypothetical protein [Catellatospora sichuanensis]|uniref:hypothetical protein n=1 Tax=Catellatospora sichuanensis TaxID=1969805 RepID=UPI001183023B|nr:hypothetical protein [Catellatospora sichuanensis]
MLMVFSDQGSDLGSASTRAAFLVTAVAAWPGWDVRWAFDGLGDMLTHLGEDVAAVRRTNRDPRPLYRDEPADAALQCLVTVGDTLAYALGEDAAPPWEVGVGLIEQLRESDRVTECTFVPEGGLHLEPTTRTAGVWSATIPLEGLAERWNGLWPGWTLQIWDGLYAEQSARSVEGIRIPAPDLDHGRERLARLVVQNLSLWVVEDQQASLAQAYPSEAYRAMLLEEPCWHSILAATAITRAELSATLRLLTGEEPEHPVWLRRYAVPRDI